MEERYQKEVSIIVTMRCAERRTRNNKTGWLRSLESEAVNGAALSK